MSEFPPLKPDFLRSLPGGKLDDSTYEAIEDALDLADAPATDGGRWLTLPERIIALTAGRKAELLAFGDFCKQRVVVHGIDISTGKDRTAVQFGVWDGDKMMVTHLYFDPSPAKIARLFRRVKQNNRRIARKANR